MCGARSRFCVSWGPPRAGRSSAAENNACEGQDARGRSAMWSGAPTTTDAADRGRQRLRSRPSATTVSSPPSAMDTSSRRKPARPWPPPTSRGWLGRRSSPQSDVATALDDSIELLPDFRRPLRVPARGDVRRRPQRRQPATKRESGGARREFVHARAQACGSETQAPRRRRFRSRCLVVPAGCCISIVQLCIGTSPRLCVPSESTATLAARCSSGSSGYSDPNPRLPIAGAFPRHSPNSSRRTPSMPSFFITQKLLANSPL